VELGLRPLSSQARRYMRSVPPAAGMRRAPHLVGRAVAVLEAAHEAEGFPALALHEQHRVHDVLQHARASNRAVLQITSGAPSAAPAQRAPPADSGRRALAAAAPPGQQEWRQA